MYRQSKPARENQVWRRLCSFLLAFAMLATFLPATSTPATAAEAPSVLYLKPNANWLADNARFAAYFFGNDETWVSMTDEDEDGYYEVTVPEGYPSVIFCRMNPSTTDNNWDNRWNQTNDLTVPSDDTNCYTVADGTWDKGGGAWSIYPPTTDDPGTESTVDYYLIGFINGANYGCEDDYANPGDYKFVDGKLTATFTQDIYVFVKTGDNSSWYMAESYCTDTTVALKNTSAGTSEKLFVPGNTELTFALAENDDDTLTLSYTTPSSDAPKIPQGHTAVTVHFLKPDGWGSATDAYIWTDGGALTGYSDYNSWPGKGISASRERSGWYDLVVATENPTPFYFIFNDGGKQTGNLHTGDVTGDTELWVVGDTVYTTAPGEWTGDYDYTANIYFQKPASWGDTVNAWIWDTNGAIPGYEQYQTTWPGSPIEADAINAGWYNLSVTLDENTRFNLILNDGNNQTADLTTGTLQVTTDLWVVDGAVQNTAPNGWVDPSRTVHVPGTLPGPSWDAASNQMTYDPELGLYVYTFENVPAANYEYKISINDSWTENYGMGGLQDGANMAVTVPSPQDVTIYYNDKTHTAVCSVTYIYDAVDYTKIDPIWGTEGDFAELVALAEENDMHIILDGVFNHVSDDSIYFDRYYKFLGSSETIGAYPYWADERERTGSGRSRNCCQVLLLRELRHHRLVLHRMVPGEQHPAGGCERKKGR